jgi:hypothetical protein
MVYFQTKNLNLGKFLEGLGRKKSLYMLCPFGILYDHLVYFTTIWYNLWPFGIFYIWSFGIACGHLVYFSHFGMFGQRKSGNPGRENFFLLRNRFEMMSK